MLVPPARCSSCGGAIDPARWARCAVCPGAALCLACAGNHLCTPECAGRGCRPGLCVREVRDGVESAQFGVSPRG